MNTTMKTLILTGLLMGAAAFATAESVVNLGKGLGRSAILGPNAAEVLTLVLSHADASTQTTLNDNKTQLEGLKTQLDTLLSTDTVDRTAVVGLRSQIRTLARSQRSTIQSVISSNTTLQAEAQTLIQTSRENNRVFRLTQGNQEAFNTLTGALTDQTVIDGLTVQRTAIQETRDALRNARANGLTNAERGGTAQPVADASHGAGNEHRHGTDRPHDA